MDHVNTSALRFEFAPAASAREQMDGYGSGILYLDGAPHWYSGSSDAPSGVEWTWIDLLEHLATNWFALLFEQSYPFDWLTKRVTHPGEMWAQAELRWSLKGDAVADREEPLLYAFSSRHNLSAGWKGIGLPGLYWFRVGNSVLLSSEDGSVIRTDFEAAVRALDEVGSLMADAFKDSDNPRVIQAVSAWKSRFAEAGRLFLEFSTGLDSAELAVLEKGRPSAEYWELQAGERWDSVHAANDNELLAAARMTKGILSSDRIAALLEIVRSLPKAIDSPIDEISVRAVQFMESYEGLPAHEAGYRLANWLRNDLALSESQSFDVDDFLKRMGVPVKNARFGSDHIEALACWGQRGPCIIVNDDRAYAESLGRLTMTLAHEICHFLIDRHNSLPAAEVLGGAVDLYVERRANAFAAELLLPRAAVALAGEAGAATLADILRYLRTQHGVSKAVACAQLFNSSFFETLTAVEQQYVMSKVQQLKGQFVDQSLINVLV